MTRVLLSRVAFALATSWSATAVLACTVDQGENAAYRDCIRDDECDPDKHCHRGYCVANPRRIASGSSDDEALESALNGERDARPRARETEAAGGGDASASPAADAAESVAIPAPDAAASEPMMSPAPVTPPDEPAAGAPGDPPASQPEPEPPPEPEPDPCVPASSDSCTAVGGVAEDEDCDGRADEGCACRSGAVQGCFDAPSRANGVGVCRAGTQSCAAGAWGTCLGATLPRTETCDGNDDDCDGKTDEGFELNKDPANCGQCGYTCTGLLQACCDGVCKTLCLL